MNRREFLQSIAALGIAVALPAEALSSASDAAIDEAWATTLESPPTFYVNEYGALSTDAVEWYETTRKALFDYEPVASREELLRFAENESSVADLLECELSDEYTWFDEDDLIPDDWEAWLETADDDTISRLVRRVNDWIDECPDDRDWESAVLGNQCGRGHALRFFRDDFEYNDDFAISIVEGDCPGSSYFAAELHMDIDDANAYAAEYGIPIRFAVQG